MKTFSGVILPTARRHQPPGSHRVGRLLILNLDVKGRNLLLQLVKAAFNVGMLLPYCDHQIQEPPVVVLLELVAGLDGDLLGRVRNLQLVDLLLDSAKDPQQSLVLAKLCGIHKLQVDAVQLSCLALNL